MTDAQLVSQFIEGDTAAFNTIARRWQGPIYNFILRYAGSRDEARDLCQKTFIRAYRSLGRLGNPERFSSWLHQIAINACKDAARSRGLRPTVSLDEGCGEGPGNRMELADNATDRPDASAHRQDVRHLLEKALGSIPEEQRVVVVMKEYQGLKFTEIADALQVPVNTVKSRMYYGLSALKKLFDQWNIDQEMLRYDV